MSILARLLEVEDVGHEKASTDPRARARRDQIKPRRVLRETATDLEVERYGGEVELWKPEDRKRVWWVRVAVK